MNAFKTNGKTVVITGSNRGIGAALTNEFLKQNWQVFGGVRRPSSDRQMQAGAAYQEFQIDVQDSNSVNNAFAKLREDFHSRGSSLDLLINNAGVYEDAEANFTEISEQALFKSFDVNAMGAMRVTKAALSLLLAAPQPLVANVSSLMGSISDNTGGGSYAYRMSKAALNMFTKSFSIDYPQIASVVLHPGWVKTEMGGPNAPTSTEDSARGLVKLLTTAKLKSLSGRFFDFEGDEISW